MSAYTHARVLQRRNWTAGLMTLTLDQNADFKPGQFFNLALTRGETTIRRSYSAASRPGTNLEFIISQVQQGALTSGLFELQEGDELLVDTQALGFFTLAEVPACQELWLVATGTGLGPFLSMIRAGALERFESVVLVHGVRHADQLAHLEEIQNHIGQDPRLVYIPALSGPVGDGAATEGGTASNALAGRITHLWDNGELEERAGAFSPTSHMLLCGNPQMIEEMAQRLKSRGFEKHRRRKAGHFNFEKYW